MPEMESGDSPKADQAPDMSRKKAEALLDNVQEDPSDMMRFMLSGENRRNTFSGRDW